MDLDDLFLAPGSLVALVLVIDFLFAITGHPAPIWPGNPLPGWLS